MDADFDLKRVVINRDELESLSPEECHALFLLGHIFNEVATLAKLIDRSRSGGDTSADAEKAGAAFLAVFFSRLLAGKIHEAHDALKWRHVSAFLRERCFPNMEPDDGRSRLKELMRAIDTCKWLVPVRNGHAMHYPGLERWTETLELLRRQKLDFQYIVSNTHFNMLYWSSDIVAGHSFFREVNDDWRSGLSQMINDVIDLSYALVDLIFDSINGCARGLRGKPMRDAKLRLKDVRRFPRPNYREFVLPYFFDVSDR